VMNAESLGGDVSIEIGYRESEMIIKINFRFMYWFANS